MRYGPIPENLAERLALAAGKVPVPAIDALFPLVQTRALMAGVKLGIFEALGDAPAPSASLAARLSLDEAALHDLLRTLAFAGYLVERGGRFALSKLARRTLLPGAPMELRGFLLWNHEQYEMLRELEALVRTGRGVDFHRSMSDPVSWANYQRAMLEIARFHAPLLARSVPVPAGAARLLDVAGSHGLFAATICRRHPPLRATVLDLPAALPHAESIAAAAGYRNLVDFVAGDLVDDDWGEGWDVVLLANILHHFQPGTAAAIAAKAHSALAPGGSVAIWELERPRRDRPASAGDGAALFFRLSSTAATYSGEEYADWLRTTGFDSIRIRRPALAPGTVLVTALATAHSGAQRPDRPAPVGG